MNQKPYIPRTRRSLSWLGLSARIFASSWFLAAGLVPGLVGSFATGLLGQGPRRVQAVAAKVQRVQVIGEFVELFDG